MLKSKAVSGGISQLCERVQRPSMKFSNGLRQARLKPEKSRQNYADLFDNASVGYFVFNRRGYVERVNLAGARMLGVGEDRLEGKPVLTLFAKASYSTFFDHLAVVCAMKDKHVCELELLRADGTTFWAQFVTVPIWNAAGDFIHFRTIVVDITDSRC